MDRQELIKNRTTYMMIGDLDKPFHLCECQCGQCENWRILKGRPTFEELQKMPKE